MRDVASRVRSYAEGRQRLRLPELLQALDLERREEARIGTLLRLMGWERRREGSGARRWYYEAPA